MKVIIDRFEGEFAICELENKMIINLHNILLPKKVKEGDILEVQISIDTTGTELRRKAIEKLSEDMWK